MVRGSFLVAVLGAALFLAVGCATKGFVRQEVQQRDLDTPEQYRTARQESVG